MEPALNSHFFSLSFAAEASVDHGLLERTLTLARPELDELFSEWAARGHVPIVAFAQPHELTEGILIEDLSSPDDGDPDETTFRAQHQGGPCKVVLHRALEIFGSFDLHFLVTDRVLESELEPILQEVSTLLLKAHRKARGT